MNALQRQVGKKSLENVSLTFDDRKVTLDLKGSREHSFDPACKAMQRFEAFFNNGSAVNKRFTLLAGHEDIP